MAGLGSGRWGLWVMRLAGVLALAGVPAGMMAAQGAAAAAAHRSHLAAAQLWWPGEPHQAASLPAAASPGLAAGNPWRIARTPNPARQANGTLLSASCAGPATCTAVGSSYNGAGITTTLAEVWNGTRWAVRVTPNPAGAAWSKLYAVSCATPWTCIATGYYVNRAGTPLPLAERWNGAQWSIQATPSPAGARASGLFAVSCPAAKGCAAVGEYNTSQGIPETFAERWNGAQWSIQATPDPAGAQASGLFGVSCPASQACTAAGSFITSSGRTMTLAERWNGQDWDIEATASPAGAASSLLVAVSCSSAQACTATGNFTDGSGTVASLAERWNGAAWSRQTVPAPAGATGSKLTAVSCSSARACTAVGSASGISGAVGAVPLAEVWNGIQWVAQAAPSPGNSSGGGFSGLACGTAYCTAAGSYSPGTGQPGIPLAEGWNGARWSIEHPPSERGAVFSEFAALSCPAPRACSAVGASVTAPGQIGPLAEGWNGTRWRIQPMPTPPGALISMLAAVSCATAHACIAVGSYTSSAGATLAFADRWNGATWRAQPIPTPAGATGSGLAAVSCATPQACTAVGSYTKDRRSPSLLAEHWNGTTWSIQPIAAPANTTSPRLSGVSCPARKVCSAVGEVTRKGQVQPLAEGWNGTTWTAQASPLPAGVPDGQLLAVSCSAARACTGTGQDSSSTSPTLAERWNGASWQVQPTPTPPGHTGPLGQPSLSAVSCTPAGGCTATGNYTRGNVPAFFIETWNGTHWRLRTAPSPPGTTSGALGGVSCTQRGCTAAGGYTGLTGVAVTLALTTTPW